MNPHGPLPLPQLLVIFVAGIVLYVAMQLRRK